MRLGRVERVENPVDHLLRDPGTKSLTTTSTLESACIVVRMVTRRISGGSSAIASIAFVAKFNRTCST